MIDAQATRGTVVGINGNMVAVELSQGSLIQNEVAYVLCGSERLKSEVIKIRGQIANLQVFEDTRGITVGQDVEFSSELLSVELAPGLLGMIYDGLQNPLTKLDNRDGFFLRRGQYLPAVDMDRRWEFNPTAKVGDSVHAGSWLGWVQELHYPHRIMAPLGMLGIAKVKEIVPKGEYKVSDQLAVLQDAQGRTIPVTMYQTWPVKRALSAYAERLYPEEHLETGIRLIDTFFPIGRGGVACIPGPFGAGKTVLQHLLAKYAKVDIVIVVACGERAGEVVETIYTFPEMEDPKTGGSLMDRTIIICNTSSMPVAAREASVYTGITLAEYYRLMGRDVLVLADSTSRWAQAMREMSGRLEEIPGEEAFPAYLESRVAGLYERAGLVRLHDGEAGAVSVIGTVSPAGGNFEEPVTQATLKVVGSFLGLSRDRANSRRYPAIHPLDSWSKYSSVVDKEKVARARNTLRQGNEVSQMMKVVGEEGTPVGDFIVFLKSEFVDAVYLQQNTFDEVDGATTAERQIYVFDNVLKVLDGHFEFADKGEARAFFQKLRQSFIDWNYTAWDSEEFRAAEQQIDDLLGNALK